MISKEWRDARWKLLLALVAFLVLLPTIRSYEAIRSDAKLQIKMMQRDLGSPGKSLPPIGERERQQYIEDTREQIREMQSPGYVEEMARWELNDASAFRNLFVVIPLAGLLGVGLISGEVGRGSIFLLLSRPVGRGQTILTKYSVSAACLLVAAAFGGLSTILTAHARGYPPESVETGRIMLSTGLMALGSLFILGVALIASVVFRDVLRTLVATVAAMFVILAGPDLLRALVDWLVWGDRIYRMNPAALPRWYDAIERFRLLNYWFGIQPYSGEPIFAQSLLVCAATATVTLLLAVWLFRQKSY